MELPKNLKALYRHWRFHIADASYKPSARSIFKSSVYKKKVEKFVHERMRIWEQKYLGKQKPYTKDKILQTYRFCNIYREFDRQTIEFHTLLNPIRDDFPLWLLNMFYFRLVANTDTVRKLGLLSFDKKRNEKFYKAFIALPRPKFGVPYVFPVSVIMKTKYKTRELFISYYLPLIMKKVADEIATWKRVSVCDGMLKVIPLFGFNLSFLWNEVLIDVAYQYPEYIDLFKAFPVGPGSAPTMNTINASIPAHELTALLAQENIQSGITYNKRPLRISSENWEGIGCEFRKYTNLSLGKGRRRVYS
jgi:hypothetical protein